MILLLDNYDSYVHNVARYLRKLGQPTEVVRSDGISVTEVIRRGPAAIVISPGPCTPDEAGISLQVVRELSGKIPILGICLGHQAIGQAFGGRVVRNRPMHGKTSLIRHTGERIFVGVENPLQACRYHSLVVEAETLPEELVALADVCKEPDSEFVSNPFAFPRELMAIAHREHPTFGLQFHPESVLTQSGFGLLANFLKLAGCELPDALPDYASELKLKQAAAKDLSVADYYLPTAQPVREAP